VELLEKKEMVFEKPITDVQNRGHIWLWQTGMLIGGHPIWIGAASCGQGIELSATTHLPIHNIAPTVALERNTGGADLTSTGLVKQEAYAAFTPPNFFARNGCNGMGRTVPLHLRGYKLRRKGALSAQFSRPGGILSAELRALSRQKLRR
jgi:LssY C-terminus